MAASSEEIAVASVELRAPPSPVIKKLRCNALGEYNDTTEVTDEPRKGFNDKSNNSITFVNKEYSSVNGGTSKYTYDYKRTPHGTNSVDQTLYFKNSSLSAYSQNNERSQSDRSYNERSQSGTDERAQDEYIRNYLRQNSWRTPVESTTEPTYQPAYQGDAYNETYNYNSTLLDQKIYYQQCLEYKQNLLSCLDIVEERLQEAVLTMQIGNSNYASSSEPASINDLYNASGLNLDLSGYVSRYEEPKNYASNYHQTQKIKDHWNRPLPKRTGVNRETYFSKKVFIGGVPWDITEDQLQAAFKKYGPFKVQWPVKETSSSQVRIKGYLYLIFESEENVNILLKDSSFVKPELDGGSVTYNCRIKCNRNKHVQIVPWLLSDNTFSVPTSPHDDLKTVFVGGLHGKLYAEALFHIFKHFFGNVVSVKIDTDEFSYPTGSGSITFSTTKSYQAAMNANYVEIETKTIGPKKIEIQHFMEDKLCHCGCNLGRKFCKDCYKYFCDGCWKVQHRDEKSLHHRAVTRNHKNRSM